MKLRELRDWCLWLVALLRSLSVPLFPLDNGFYFPLQSAIARHFAHKKPRKKCHPKKNAAGNPGDFSRFCTPALHCSMHFQTGWPGRERRRVGDCIPDAKACWSVRHTVVSTVTLPCLPAVQNLLCPSPDDGSQVLEKQRD